MCFRGRAAWRLALFSFLGLSFAASQPEDPAAKSQRAKEMMAAGQFSQAIPIYEELLRAMPDNPGIRLDLAT